MQEQEDKEYSNQSNGQLEEDDDDYDNQLHLLKNKLMDTTESKFQNSTIISEDTNTFIKTRVLSDEKNGKQEKTEKSTLFNRWFGKMEKGSVTGMIFFMIQTAVGSGVLALPAVASRSGIVLFACFLVLSGVIVYLSQVVMAWGLYKANVNDYGLLVGHCYGNCGEHFLNFMFIFTISGGMMGFQVMLGKIIPHMLESFNLVHTWDQYDKILQLLIMNLCVFPLVLFKELTSLRYFNMLGFCTVFYTAFVIAIEAKDWHETYYDPKKFKLYDFGLSTPLIWATALYGYFSHTGIPKMKEELIDGSFKKANKVIKLAHFNKFKILFAANLTEIILYTIIGVGGYWAMCDKTPDVIVIRKGLDGQDDILMTLAQFAFTLNLMICIPTCALPVRDQIRSAFRIKTKSPVLHVLLSLLILAFPAIVAYLIPQILDLMGIIGGIFLTILGVTLPGMCYYKLNGPYKCVVMFFTVILSCIGFTASLLSLLDTIGIYKLN